MVTARPLRATLICLVGALVLGTASHALDYDDVAMSAHPSTVLVPAILAEAQACGAEDLNLAAAGGAAIEPQRAAGAEGASLQLQPVHGGLLDEGGQGLLHRCCGQGPMGQGQGQAGMVHQQLQVVPRLPAWGVGGTGCGLGLSRTGQHGGR